MEADEVHVYNKLERDSKLVSTIQQVREKIRQWAIRPFRVTNPRQ